MIEELNNRFEIEIAKEIGLTFEELQSTNYTIDEMMNSDGLHYGYKVNFAESVPEDLLKKIRYLKNNSVFVDLGVIERADDYYDVQLDAISTTKEQYNNFHRELVNIQELLKIKSISERQRNILLRQVYISVFGTMETYLSDTFIWLVRSNDDYLRKFVESYDEFKKRKFELREVFISHDSIKEVASKVMLDIIYHDLRKVKIIYSSTFNISFPSISNMMGYLAIRHHLVHRNGKNKEGVLVPITDDLVEALISEVAEFIKAISVQLPIDDGLPF